MCENYSANISAAVPSGNQQPKLEEGAIADISVNYPKQNFLPGETVRILNYDDYRKVWAVVSTQDETFGYIEDRYLVNPRAGEKVGSDGWIVEREKKPPFDVWVLCHCAIYGTYIGAYMQIDNTGYGNWHDGKSLGVLPPIYWQPLPQIPQDK